MSATEREAIRTWVFSGAPKVLGGVHPVGFYDPRTPESHGRFLRAEGWKSMTDKTSETACGRCHDGTPSGRPEGITESAIGATACTTCHSEAASAGPVASAGGVLACGTCHGSGTTKTSSTAFPPRDPCFFPGEAAKAGAHEAHLKASDFRGALACATCHPTPSAAVFEGVHANGKVDVTLTDSPTSSYDQGAQACATSCHAREGGTHTKPLWSEHGPLDCNSCHSSPPPQHYAGTCTTCHTEANATGSALTANTLHMNGRVDVGDGKGQCGSCHGSGADPWPTTGSHARHRSPSSSSPIACETCHVVPTSSGKGTGHPRVATSSNDTGAAKVTMSGLAQNRGAAATFSAGSCKNVYCHGEGVVGTTAATPAWATNGTPGQPSTCTACHGIPPGAPHGPVTACWSCHPSVVDPGPNGAPVVSVPSRHLNGVTDK